MADAFAPQPAVLLVEDDPVQLMEAAASLRDAGYAGLHVRLGADP